MIEFFDPAFVVKNLRFYVSLPLALSAVWYFSIAIWQYKQHQNAKQNYRQTWKGYLLLSIANTFLVVFSLLIKLSKRIEIAAAVVIVVLWVLGFYFTRQERIDDRMAKEAVKESRAIPQKDISKPVGLMFGLFTLAFVPVSFFFTTVFIFGMVTEKTQRERLLSIAGVIIFGMLSVFLAVVGWRLIRVRKGWTGSLFSPSTLWLRVSGWLFLLVGVIKLTQTLTGLLGIVIGLALLVLSGKKATNVEKTN